MVGNGAGKNVAAAHDGRVLRRQKKPFEIAAALYSREPWPWISASLRHRTGGQQVRKRALRGRQQWSTRRPISCW